MYTNLYVYMTPRLFMSGKLYWRLKVNGKWTWRPAKISEAWSDVYKTYVFNLEEEE